MNIDWDDIETPQAELDSFNEYYRYVERLISEKEGLIYGKFSVSFEYSFSKRKGGINIVTYYKSGTTIAASCGQDDTPRNRSKKSLKSIEVAPYDIWKIRENRNKLLEQLGI